MQETEGMKTKVNVALVKPGLRTRHLIGRGYRKITPFDEITCQFKDLHQLQLIAEDDYFGPSLGSKYSLTDHIRPKQSFLPR